ncbi:MAG: tRNA pseudouridine(13) synthase TruD, partial [Candidatus Thorarchaeota archaeon]
MKEVFPLENAIGMELYSTTIKGIGGSIKSRFEDFIVEEILPDKATLEVDSSLLDTISTINQEVDGDASRAKFIHLAVQKMGINTMDVASLLASLLRLPRHLVSYA